MFSSHADKVDKRGRKVNKSSSDDLRKYYELEGMGRWRGRRERGRQKNGL